MKYDLLLIDPQVDFCDPSGALFVPGADDDSKKLAAMILRVKSKINDIHVTLDTHHYFDIAHPCFWLDQSGRHPDPFTLISYSDIKVGKWKTSIPAYQNRKTLQAHGIDRDGAEEYVLSLEKNNRYMLCIWPPHCLIGSIGASIQPDVYSALQTWETEKVTAFVDYVTKGSNFWTEHYSAVQADVPDPSDPTTQLNIGLIELLKQVDLIGISGQALSHCVANTIRDISNNFGDENIKKFVLLKDTSSNVPRFEKLGEDFITEMTSRGMQVMNSTEFLA